MKRLLVAWVLAIMLVLGPTSGASDAAVPTSCTTVQIVGLQIKVECIKNILVPVPGPTITVRPPQATRTVHVTVPGPTVTVTSPSSPRTIRVPGPTQTVTKTAASAPVQTETVSGPTATATSTVTESPSVSPIDKTPESHVFWGSHTRTVGYSALALLALTGLIIFALWLGYLLGFKDSERKERRFLRALRDQFYYKRQH